MKNILYKLAFVIATALWCISFYLLLSKHPNIGGFRIPHGAHSILFFGLAFMTTCAQRNPKIVLTLAILYCFGGMTEIAQHFSPPRTCDLMDYIEDVVGATVGLFVALGWMSLLRYFLRFASASRSSKKKTITSGSLK